MNISALNKLIASFLTPKETTIFRQVNKTIKEDVEKPKRPVQIFEGRLIFSMDISEKLELKWPRYELTTGWYSCFKKYKDVGYVRTTIERYKVGFYGADVFHSPHDPKYTHDYHDHLPIKLVLDDSKDKTIKELVPTERGYKLTDSKLRSPELCRDMYQQYIHGCWYRRLSYKRHSKGWTLYDFLSQTHEYHDNEIYTSKGGTRCHGTQHEYRPNVNNKKYTPNNFYIRICHISEDDMNAYTKEHIYPYDMTHITQYTVYGKKAEYVTLNISGVNRVSMLDDGKICFIAKDKVLIYE